MKPAMRLSLGVLLAGMLGLGSGCAVVSDIFNPDFAGALGLNADAVTGTVIVVFENETSSAAEFVGFGIQSANGTEGVDFGLPVGAGESGNVVLDCPLYSVDLGTPGEDLTSDKVGATVFAAEGNVDVTYGGATLVSPEFFSCGDVIVVTLMQTTTGGDGDDGTDAQAAYRFQVEVIPGS